MLSEIKACKFYLLFYCWSDCEWRQDYFVNLTSFGKFLLYVSAGIACAIYRTRAFMAFIFIAFMVCASDRTPNIESTGCVADENIQTCIVLNEKVASHNNINITFKKP